MKIEKWTLGLAAIGLVTLAPALQAQMPPPQLVPVQTALTATTISGYVDTSAVWNPGTGNANPAPYAFNSGKQDGFNLDAIDLKISKPLDETQWSAGYTFELSYGPDAQAIDSSAYPIRQAFVAMRIPVGNGLDLDFGRWDSLLGFESSDSMANWNYTRSYGKTFEPTENTGLLISYKFCDSINLHFGVSDALATDGLNARSDGVTSPVIESKKAILSLLTLTAPDSWGFLKGSTLSGGFDLGQGYTTLGYAGGTALGAVPAHDRSEWYIGTKINTPVKGLTFGGSYDAIEHNDVGAFASEAGLIGLPAGVGVDTGYFQSYAGYMMYQATDKLALSARCEYAEGFGLGAAADVNNLGNVSVGEIGGLLGGGALPAPNPLDKVLAVTGTVEYDLWANVITRLEVRWDHAANGADSFGGNNAFFPTRKNEVMVAANVIYKF